MDVGSIYRTLVWKSGDVVPILVLVLTSLLKHSPQSHRSVGKQVIFMFCALHLPICEMGMTTFYAIPFLIGDLVKGKRYVWMSYDFFRGKML